MTRDAIFEWNGLRARNAAGLRETRTLRAARGVWPSEWTEARVTDPAQRGLRPAAIRARRSPLSTRSSARRSLELANWARLHRFALTESEARLWEALRRGQLGVRFRRQAVLGRYIADFFAPEPRLVVEVDGGYHQLRRTADARRDEWMRRRGYRVVRVSAAAVMSDVGDVVDGIAAVVREGVG